MKEYLTKNNHGNYELVYQKWRNDDIEVPDGASVYARCNIFGDYKWLPKIIDGDWSVLWQRHTQPEELPFMDSLPEFKHGFGASSLNDQYAEIEQVRQQTIEATLAERQAQYGCFEDVAFVTENIMATLSKVRSNGLTDLPHTHRMALYMICSKIARIVNGDYNHKDSWHDIGGYSKLIEDLL